MRAKIPEGEYTVLRFHSGESPKAGYKYPLRNPVNDGEHTWTDIVVLEDGTAVLSREDDE